VRGGWCVLALTTAGAAISQIHHSANGRFAPAADVRRRSASLLMTATSSRVHAQCEGQPRSRVRSASRSRKRTILSRRYTTGAHGRQFFREPLRRPGAVVWGRGCRAMTKALRRRTRPVFELSQEAAKFPVLQKELLAQTVARRARAATNQDHAGKRFDNHR
jgi:hypothetical protein